jgi:hypothetical protein
MTGKTIACILASLMATAAAMAQDAPAANLRLQLSSSLLVPGSSAPAPVPALGVETTGEVARDLAVGDAIALGVAPSGGLPPYRITPLGSAPSGLSVQSGAYAGPVADPGSYDFRFLVEDSSVPPLTVETRSWAFDAWAGMTVTSPSAHALARGFLGTIPAPVVTGGKPPITFTLKSGLTPVGTTVANGVLTGTPTTASSGSYVLTATDGMGRKADITMPWSVGNYPQPAYNAAVTVTSDGVAIVAGQTFAKATEMNSSFQGTLANGVRLAVGQSITLDYGSPVHVNTAAHSIARDVDTPACPHAQAGLTFVDLQASVSQDGLSWTPAGSFARSYGSGGLGSHISASTAFPAAIARYVRLTVKDLTASDCGTSIKVYGFRARYL